MPAWLSENWIVALIVAVFGGGGVTALYQAWGSRNVGVREQDVTAQKNSGDLALELIRELRGQIKDLQASGVESDQRLDAVERENAELRWRLAQFETAIRDTIASLTELIAWEQAGSKPPAPVPLVAVLNRLTRLTRLTHRGGDRDDA